MRKQKNKAIAGRRNRCHALPPLPLILKVNKDIPERDVRRMSQEIERSMMDGNRGRFLVIADPQDAVEIINPNVRKRPRLLS